MPKRRVHRPSNQFIISASKERRQALNDLRGERPLDEFVELVMNAGNIRMPHLHGAQAGPPPRRFELL